MRFYCIARIVEVSPVVQKRRPASKTPRPPVIPRGFRGLDARDRMKTRQKVFRPFRPPRPYREGADELLHTGDAEANTPQNLHTSTEFISKKHMGSMRYSDMYQLTEICIGYKYLSEEKSSKVYVMNIFQKDSELFTIRMIVSFFFLSF